MIIKDMPPFAPVLMESTRAMGYSLETAIADIIDNSIAAGATAVDVDFSPYETEPYISILDDGIGMTEDEIDDAMRYGSQSSLDVRAERDLGRFGLGLKTASLSQCRCLTVITKKNNHTAARRWDLDEIYRQGFWALQELEESDLSIISQYQAFSNCSHGTLILWHKLDRLFEGTASPQKLMNKRMDFVRDHLSLVFHRYISGEKGLDKLELRLNGLPVEPKDPFLIGRSTLFQDEEHFAIEGQEITVSAYMLPHISYLTPHEKNILGGNEGLTKDQGFYIYRNKRLLVWGTWFRMHRKDELSKLARVKVDIPNSLDHLWTLDIRKSSAIPPDVIKVNLSRVVDRISEGSKRAWTFRGKREVGDNGCHLWTKNRTRDGVVYSLNRDHAFLEMLYEQIGGNQQHLLESYLKLIEDNLPLNQLYVDLNNEERVNVRGEKEAEKEALEMIRIFLGNIKDDPRRNDQIGILLQTDPFCNFKSVITLLKKELNSHEQ